MMTTILTSPLIGRLCFAVVFVLLMADVPAIAETYQYDDAGRLLSVTYDDGSNIAYTYDANGNLLEVDNKTAADNQPPTVTIGLGGNTTAVSTSAAPGDNGVVLMRFEIDLNFTTTLSSLSLQSTGSGNPVADVAAVEVYEDVNQDEALDAGDRLVGGGQYDADGLLNLMLSPAYTISAGRRVFLVVYDFAG